MTIPGARAALADVLRRRAVEPVYQPVVDLDREVVVGYEALARGADGCGLAGADALFAAARSSGRLVELDWLCREQAVDGARRAGLRHPLSLFVNAEPETLLASDGDAERWAQFADVRCYCELTERALGRHPAALLHAVEQVRAQDWGIALDDVGAEPQSLALLPLVRPDVIKLDLRLVQAAPGQSGDLPLGQVLHSALAQAADTGAVVVAEGIETERHLDLARAYGAQYGQGYLLGRPGPLPAPLTSPPVAVPLLDGMLARAVAPAPFALLASRMTTRSVQREAALELTCQLLSRAVSISPEPVVLLCCSDDSLLPAHVEDLLRALPRSPLIGAVGTSGLRRPLPVTTTRLEAADPAVDDFDVVVVSDHYAAALVSRPGLAQPPGGALDLVLTFDRELVCQAAHALLRRLDGPGPTSRP